MNKTSRKSLVFSHGFTIVELLVVIVVIGILAAIIITSYTGMANKANEATVISDLANAKRKIALYYVEHNMYPSYLDDATKCLKNEAGVADNNYCLKLTIGNLFIYTPNSVTTPNSYELTATRGSVNYKVTNDLAPAIVNLPVGQPLANWTWDQIAQVSAAGTASTYFQIGNTKDIALSTGEVLTMQIYGFNHDDKSDGTGKAGITFGTKELMSSPKLMISTYAWETTDVRTWANGVLLSQLPTELGTRIKSIDKYSWDGNYPSQKIIKTSDKIFLFSEIEMFGINTVTLSGEGYKYPIFSNNSSRIKKMSNGSGAANLYWGRSGVTNRVGYFFLTTAEGDFNGLPGSDNWYGICFGFSI